MVRIEWAIDQSEGSLANKRVVRLEMAVDQSEGGLANKRVVRLGRAIDPYKQQNFLNQEIHWDMQYGRHLFISELDTQRS